MAMAGENGTAAGTDKNPAITNNTAMETSSVGNQAATRDRDTLEALCINDVSGTTAATKCYMVRFAGIDRDVLVPHEMFMSAIPRERAKRLLKQFYLERMVVNIEARFKARAAEKSQDKRRPRPAPVATKTTTASSTPSTKGTTAAAAAAAATTTTTTTTTTAARATARRTLRETTTMPVKIKKECKPEFVSDKLKCLRQRVRS